MQSSPGLLRRAVDFEEIGDATGKEPA